MTNHETLNQAAMQIILFSGNGRNLINEALSALDDAQSFDIVKEKMAEAKQEITKAHKIQTEMIQSTIEDDNLQSTLLFSHAQDTLMTIYSELNIGNHLVKLYEKLLTRIEGL